MILPTPIKGAVFYEDEKLYAALANEPLVNGHSVVVWKNDIEDLHLLNREDYEYLMNKVDEIRTAIMNVLKVEKVYLMYLDEANHVHWHLIPSHHEGIHIFDNSIGKLDNISLAKEFREAMNQ